MKSGNNSSNSTFELVMKFHYRNTTNDSFYMCGKPGGKEKCDQYHEVRANLSPKKLGTCKNINELISMLNENIIAEGKRIIDQDYRAESYKEIIEDLEENGSMIKIKCIQVGCRITVGKIKKIDWYEYDLQTGEYTKSISDDIIGSDVTGGALIVPDADQATEVKFISTFGINDETTGLTDYLHYGNSSELANDVVVYVPETVRLIEFSSIYSDCEEIHIGKNVEKIESREFYLPKLKKIIIDEQNKYYRVEGNALIENETSAIITIIDKSAKEFVFPEGVKKISSYAFYKSNLTSVKVPEGVEKISYGAFAECKKLKKLELPSSLVKISDDLFGGRQSVAIKAPLNSFAHEYVVKNKLRLDNESVEDSGDAADLFRDKTFSLIGFNKKDAGEIQKTVGVLGGVARDAVSTKTNYVVYASKNNFEDLAYYKALFLMMKGQKIIFLTANEMEQMKENNVLPPQDYFENEVQRIAQGGEQAMFIKGNTLLRYIGFEKKVVVPDGIVRIAESAFSEMPVEEVVLPDTVRRIEQSAFSKCNKLVKVNIPSGVDALCMSVFSGCSNLENITIPDAVTVIDKNAFLKCKKLTAIKIPDAVRIIDESAFNACECLTDLTIGKSVRKIGSTAFYCCAALESVTLPDGINEIGYYAFEKTKIKQIILPKFATGGNLISGIANAKQIESIVILNDNYDFSHNVCGFVAEVTLLNKCIKFIGRKGSKTEAFAKKNNYQFEVLDDTNVIHNK